MKLPKKVKKSIIDYSFRPSFFEMLYHPRNGMWATWSNGHAYSKSVFLLGKIVIDRNKFELKKDNTFLLVAE